MNGAVVTSLFLFHVPLYSSIPNSLSLLRMIFFLPSSFFLNLHRGTRIVLKRQNLGGSCFVVWFPPFVSDTLPFSVAAQTKGKR